DNELAFFIPCDEEDDELCMAERLRAAVEEYQDKILRGLNALSEGEIQQSVAEFKSKFAPQEPATVAQIANFNQSVAEFEAALWEMNRTNRIMLLVSSAEGEYERSLLPSNPLLQQSLSTPRVQ
ncbi:MAG: hypothetical protein FWF80_03240, partial [Defluviitaleaceae bacterium]|nr:hypothetical protein [Defluviitaleaceae bacterium]